MSKGASAWVKSFRRRAEAYAGHPAHATQGTRLSYWEAKAAGAFSQTPAAVLTRKPTPSPPALTGRQASRTLADIMAMLLAQKGGAT